MEFCQVRNVHRLIAPGSVVLPDVTSAILTKEKYIEIAIIVEIDSKNLYTCQRLIEADVFPDGSIGAIAIVVVELCSVATGD